MRDLSCPLLIEQLLQHMQDLPVNLLRNEMIGDKERVEIK